jgi:hypothetical protein
MQSEAKRFSNASHDVGLRGLAALLAQQLKEEPFYSKTREHQRIRL